MSDTSNTIFITRTGGSLITTSAPADSLPDDLSDDPAESLAMENLTVWEESEGE